MQSVIMMPTYARTATAHRSMQPSSRDNSPIQEHDSSGTRLIRAAGRSQIGPGHTTADLPI
jgi:hypothetical protein